MPRQRSAERNLQPVQPTRLRGPFGTIIGSTPMSRILAQKKAQAEGERQAKKPSSFGGLGGLLGSILGFAVGGPAGAAIGGGLGGAAGGMASDPGTPASRPQIPIPAGSVPGATGTASAMLGAAPIPEQMDIPDWQRAAGIANMAIGPLLNSLGPQVAAPPVDPYSLASGAGGPPSMSEWPGATYQQPSALPLSVPQPMPQTRVPPSLFPGGSNFVPQGGGYTPQAPTPSPIHPPYQPPPRPRRTDIPGPGSFLPEFPPSPLPPPRLAQNQFPMAPSGMIPGALANFSVSDFLNPNVQTPDITQLIQQQILAGMV